MAGVGVENGVSVCWDMSVVYENVENQQSFLGKINDFK